MPHVIATVLQHTRTRNFNQNKRANDSLCFPNASNLRRDCEPLRNMVEGEGGMGLLEFLQRRAEEAVEVIIVDCFNRCRGGDQSPPTGCSFSTVR